MTLLSDYFPADQLTFPYEYLQSVYSVEIKQRFLQYLVQFATECDDKDRGENGALFENILKPCEILLQ